MSKAGLRAENKVAVRLGLPRNVGGHGRVTIPGTGKGGYRVPDFDLAKTIPARGTLVEFDGYRDGVLLDAKGPGYAPLRQERPLPTVL